VLLKSSKLFKAPNWQQILILTSEKKQEIIEQIFFTVYLPFFHF
jgi:hypothetical protein